MKKWSHFPLVLLHRGGYLSLDARTSVMVHRLYATCDRWGRGAAGSTHLSFALGVDKESTERGLDTLEANGLIEVFETLTRGPAFQLVDYDASAPRDVTRNRAPSYWQPA